MRKSAMVAFVLMIVPYHVFGDELLLKNGKRIEWVTLRDNGKEYEVTQASGVRLTVKKDDVKEFVKTDAGVPLTGATFEFKKEQKLTAVDLFKGLDLDKAPKKGTWSTVNGALAGSSDQAAHIEFPSFAPPGEYDFTVIAERTGGAKHFITTLPMFGSPFRVFVDKDSQMIVAGVDGKDWDQSPVRVEGAVFGRGKPVTLTFMVRLEGLVIRVDGKDHLTWRGDWLSKGDVIKSLKNDDVISVGMWASSYKITRAVVTFPKK